MENSGNMKKELDKVYSPTEIEDKWYKIWEENGYFSAQHNDEKPGYSIVIPPPNVTGILHMGHMLDNTIQDAIIRYKRMSGFDTLWVPGMDHAGIATQNKVERMLKEQGTSKEEIGREEFLKKTWEWKEKHGGLITKQLRKLGVSPDWSRERFTMDEGLSRAVKEVFIKLYNDGLIYRGEYIVNWCPHDKTALADDEVNHFEKNGKIWEIKYPIKDSDGYVVIATTRPETMLGDTGVAVNPNDERYKDLIGKKVILPLMDREIPVVADEYVDMEFGTGVVKMTPSHDPNDFEVAKRTGLPFLNIFTEDAKVNENGGKYCGLERFEARKTILKDLEEQGYLVGVKEHKNAVGHCYRCDSVIEPRVSTQWFVKMKPLAERALEVVKNGKIQITPKRWEKVYYNWLENIRDWTISRQRVWGVPIPIFYNRETNEVIYEPEIMDKVIELVKKEGTDIWWKYEAEEIIGEELLEKYNLKDTPLRKERSIMDVWFDSGVSHRGVLVPRELPRPADLYLEGSDQHRGWFQSSLLTSIASTKDAPYKRILTHGFVMDGQGRKMSKSLGNTILPKDITEKYGADILRLWVSSVDYREDVRISENILQQMSDAYRRIRNTARFLMGNLSDFNYSEDKVEYNEMFEIDKWAMHKLEELKEKTTKYYDKYEFYSLFQEITYFCSIEMSSFYLDIVKDRLYCENKKSLERRSAQTVLTEVLRVLVRVISPVLSFTAEEIWERIPESIKEEESVHLTSWIEANPEYKNEELAKKWEKIYHLRKEVNKKLEAERQAGMIGHSLDARVLLNISNDEYAFLKEYTEAEVSDLFIVSQVKFVNDRLNESEIDGITIAVEKASGEKCERCWKYDEEVGHDHEHTDVCPRCAKVLNSLEK